MKDDKKYSDTEKISKLSKELTQMAVDYKLFDIVNNR
jgi:hypothetical protein